MPQLGGWLGGCGAERWGCSMRAEGFPLLSGGVGGLGFGGEYPSPLKDVLGWGMRVPAGVPLTPLCLPAAGKPPKPYGGALGALGFRGEHGAPARRALPCLRPSGIPGGLRAQGGLIPHPPAGGAGCAAGKYCGRKRK